MTTKLFKNAGGNQFKLITENVTSTSSSPSISALQSGLKKVFSESVGEISYMKIQNMGLGFIKDVFSAKKCALDESRILAEEFGYKDDASNKKFIKEDGEMSSYDVGNYENPVSRPIPSSDELATGKNAGWGDDEKREVQIGKEILSILGSAGMDRAMETEKGKLRQLANELIQMHGQQP